MSIGGVCEKGRESFDRIGAVRVVMEFWIYLCYGGEGGGNEFRISIFFKIQS